MIRLAENITKTCLYNFDPLIPRFYTHKQGFTGYTLIFLFLLKNINCEYSLEPPRRGCSNEYPLSMFWAEIWKNIRFFFSEKFPFLVVEFSIYLNRSVFVMNWPQFLHLKEKRYTCFPNNYNVKTRPWSSGCYIFGATGSNKSLPNNVDADEPVYNAYN